MPPVPGARSAPSSIVVRAVAPGKLIAATLCGAAALFCSDRSSAGPIEKAEAARRQIRVAASARMEGLLPELTIGSVDPFTSRWAVINVYRTRRGSFARMEGALLSPSRVAAGDRCPALVELTSDEQIASSLVGLTYGLSKTSPPPNDAVTYVVLSAHAAHRGALSSIEISETVGPIAGYSRRLLREVSACLEEERP